MNWVDIAVLCIIGGFAVYGIINGLVLSIFRIGSFFAAIFISIKFYPKVAEILQKTSFFTGIKKSFYNALMIKKPAALPAIGGGTGDSTAGSVVEQFKLPGFLKEKIAERLSTQTSFIDTAKIMDIVSDELAKIVIAIASLIILYILVRIALYFLKIVLQGVTKLPVIRQVDKLGGLVLGLAEGILTVYIVFAVLLLFNSNPAFAKVFQAVDSSAIARFFYQGNFIIGWMF